MSVPPQIDGFEETVASHELSPDTLFDPGASFDQWFESVADFRNRQPSAPVPGFYLENGDWTIGKEPGFDNEFAERFSSEGTLVVNTHGRLQGNIEVGSAVIDGIFRGKIMATESVVLENHALVIGEIHTPSLAIRGGAIIEGTCYFETKKQERLDPPRWELLKVSLTKVWRGRVSQ